MATRIVLDTRAVACPRTAGWSAPPAQAPVLVAVGPEAPAENVPAPDRGGLRGVGVRRRDRAARLEQLLEELGRRQMTNVLVEGGGQLLGSLFDARAVDEVHVFLASQSARRRRGTLARRRQRHRMGGGRPAAARDRRRAARRRRLPARPDRDGSRLTVAPL